LPQVQQHRVAQGVGRRPALLFFVIITPPRMFDFGGINNLNFEAPELGQDVVQIVRRRDFRRQDRMHVIMRQMALVVGQLHKFFDLRRQVRGGP
jgi:hypothetical protein